ncbi:XRE family transcriptional regulator [Nostoc sp. LEGE 12450]|uniref:XRE family transcriptional regulator n=1 Tax=Nostoc sp. LEGE 12450 TaxID=1828643 RepID=UPI001D15AF6D|nr:XRE family transcriptional regulator [Nostoc sp. LEGE 12450]
MDKQESQSFGRCIWQARRKKGLSQRELAAKIGVDYTYLSKLENDHVEPSEKVIRSLAEHLSLNAEQLMYLAGRMTQNDSEAFEQLLKVNYKEMPALFRRMRESPGIDSLVNARDEQIARLQKENAELRDKVAKLQNRFYSKYEIENIANDLLSRIQISSQYAPKLSIDTTRVCDFLNLSICHAQISPDERGLIIAMILPLERTILINNDIPEVLGAFTESTIAHEIGHWLLHVNKNENEALWEQRDINTDIKETNNPFFCRSASEPLDKYIASSQLDKIEWQAQYFASCLLMPRHVLQKISKGRDLTNWKHLYRIKDELGVTISNLINRLQDIGWIYIPKGSKQIFPGSMESESQRIKYWL